MRRIGFRLGLAACLMLLVGAVQIPKPAAPKAAPVSASGLRGEQGKPTKAAPIASPVLRANLPASADQGFAADPGQCHAGCAHTYYFCLAGDDAPSCPQNWTACLASCNRAPIQPQAALP
jgi:hypothetical protein